MVACFRRTSSGRGFLLGRDAADPRWPAGACSTTTESLLLAFVPARRACPTTARWGVPSWPTSMRDALAPVLYTEAHR